MRRSLLALTTLSALFVLATAASAQTGRVSFEARGGLTSPQGDLEDRNAGAGFAGGLDLMINMSPYFTLYAGGSRDHFDGGFSATGVQGGLKVIPTGYGNVLPWLSGGVIGMDLEVPDDIDAEFSAGWEAGAGADIAVSENFSLTPGVRYRSFNAEFERQLDEPDVRSRYWAFTLGLHLHTR